MGAYLDAFDDKWTSSAELDEGWGLDDEARSIPRAVPPQVNANIVNLHTCLNDHVAADWSLAHELERRVPEVSMRSALVNPLTDEEIEEFSRAELAMGTEVGMPVSEELWFEDLRCLVPRRRAPSVSDSLPAVRLPQARLPQASLPLVANSDSLPEAHTIAPPASKKARWWQLRKRS
tara:strand:+ start:61169 stop:61699 length:531 start_codon:yes stop_codon:yes gene_type:complete